MATKTVTYYSQNFESLDVGDDMESNGYTQYPYAAEDGTFKVVAGKYGEFKATVANWIGGFEYDNGSDFGDCTIEFDVKSYASGRYIFGFRSSASGAYWIQHIPASNIIRLYKADRTFLGATVQLEDWDSVAPGSASSVKIILENQDNGDVKITLYIDDVYIAEHTDSVYKYTSGSVIFGAYQAGWVVDNIQIYDTYTLTYTNAECMKLSTLQVESAVEFELNLGTTLDDAIDITKYVVNIEDINEKLSKSNVTSGGVILPNLQMKLNNKYGKFNKTGEMFKKGFINNSIIKITTNYVSPDNETIADEFVYRGILKYTSCKWNRIKHILEITLLSPSCLFASEKVLNGILSATTTPTFADVIYKILNRQPYTKYLTIDSANIELGWDVDAIDQYSDMTGAIVKNVLDEIMLLTGSVYYINYDQEFIVEPAIESSPTSVCTFRGEDIMEIHSEEYDWKNHYTAIKWDDNENTVQQVNMDYVDRELYQYDYIELLLTNQYITNSTNRKTILDNLLTLYKYLKREVKITCKWNPDVIVNSYITLDVPQEAIIDNDLFIWNENQWNDSKHWGLLSEGINFSSEYLWRVLEVKRNPEGKKMQLTLIQQYSDDEV